MRRVARFSASTPHLHFLLQYWLTAGDSQSWAVMPGVMRHEITLLPPSIKAKGLKEYGVVLPVSSRPVVPGGWSQQERDRRRRGHRGSKERTVRGGRRNRTVPVPSFVRWSSIGMIRFSREGLPLLPHYRDQRVHEGRLRDKDRDVAQARHGGNETNCVLMMSSEMHPPLQPGCDPLTHCFSSKLSRMALGGTQTCTDPPHILHAKP